MRKEQELSSPQSCMNKARAGEMVFVLLAHDSEAAATVRYWAMRRVFNGKNKITDPQITEALECADIMEREAPCYRG